MIRGLRSLLRLLVGGRPLVRPLAPRPPAAPEEGPGDPELAPSAPDVDGATHAPDLDGATHAPDMDGVTHAPEERAP